MFSAGDQPYAMFTDDLDGDGKPDVVVTNRAANTISVLRNLSSSGAIDLASRTFFAAGNRPLSLAAGDFDGDSRIDLTLAGIVGPPNFVIVLRNSGDFTFAPTNYGMAARPESVAVGDFNGDAKPDIVSTGQDNPRIEVRMNRGDGTLLPQVNLTTLNMPTVVTVGDLDQNGKPDIVVGYAGTITNISFFLNRGDGSYFPRSDIPFGTTDLRGVTIGDLDGSNGDDLAIAEALKMKVLLNNGDNTFRLGYSQAYSDPLQSIALGDVDGINGLDIAYARQGRNEVTVHRNNGNGTFGDGFEYSTGDAPRSVAIRDMDSDGLPDLVVANEVGDTVSVLRNRMTRTVYVNSTITTGANDGTSWANAYRDLRTALADLQSAPWVRELWVAAGTYTPAPPNGPRTASFNLRNNLAIYGGFAGNETSLSQRNITQNPTILSGDLAANDSGELNRLDNSFHVVALPAGSVGGGRIVDGFTITAGDASGSQDLEGGAVFQVDDAAGATFSNCTFVRNRSNEQGGAVYSKNSAITFDKCGFLDNVSRNAAGGAILAEGSQVQMDRCTFEGNSCVSAGGAACVQGQAVFNCSRSDFVRNRCTSSAQVFGGGAIWVGSREVTDRSFANIHACRFFGNSANTGSVASAYSGAVVNLVGCLMAGNHARDSCTVYFGAEGNFTSFGRIHNCTVIGNTAVRWAGIEIEGDPADPQIEILNSILWANSGGTGLGTQANQLITFGHPSVNLAIRNTIVAGWDGSLVQGSPGNNGSDPLVSRLPAPGPDGQFGTADDDYGTPRLTIDSPALDSGSNADVPLDALDQDGDNVTNETIPYDLDGSPRIQNNTADRGCYEGFRCPTCPNDRQWFSPQSGAWADDSRWSFSLPTLCHFATFDLAGAYDATFATGDQARGFEQSRGDVTLVGVLPTSVLTLAPPAPGQSCPGTAPGIERPSFRVSGAIAESPSLSITRGTVSAKGGFIGDGYLERGSVSVSGIDAKLTFNLGAGLLLVGDSGEGKLAVTNGAKCFAGIAYFGQQDIDLDSPPDGVFDNHATLLVDGTGSALKPKFELVLSNAVATVRNSGVIDCGTFGRVILLNRSVLTGDGEVWGPLLNLGEVAPGDDARATPGPFTPTRLSITGPAGAGGGEFLQIGVDLKTGNQQSGSLRLRASGTGTAIAADTLRVNGTAFLAGTLVVEPVGAFAPATAVPAAPLLIADAITGRFDLAAFPGIDGNRFLRLDYPPQGARAGSVTVSVAPLDQNINLDPPSTANVGGVPSAIAAEDFNGDGFIDLALTVPDSANPTTAPGTVVILINNRNSGSNWNGFQPSGQLTVNVGINPRGLAAARINADNAVDLVVANAGSNNLTVLTNNGAALMSTAQTIAVGTSPVAVTTDVLLPGQPGAATFVAVANQGSNNVSVLNNNAGTLVPAGTLAAGDSPSDITAARLDALSATVDLAVCNKGDNTVTVYYRPPAGGFNPIPSRILPVSTQPVRIRPGAFDEPGGLDNPKEINDLAVTNNGGGSISILLNNNLPDAGAGFQPKADLPCGTNPDSIAVGDLDRDDDQDISVVTTISAQRVVRIFRNDSQPVPGGGFQAAFAPLPQDAYAGTGPRLVIAGDVNEDGREDLIAVNEQAFSFRTLPDGEADRMLVQQPNVSASLSVPPLPACIPADINRDGMVNVSDLTKFLGQFGKPCSTIADPCADFDGNGVVNTTDLTRFLGRFGQPCQ